MRKRLVITVLGLGLLVAGAAFAAGPPTQVAGVVISSGPAPRMAASFPAEGSTVPGGVLVLKLVFDQPMAADGWSYEKLSDAAFPDCLGKPRMLADKRTFVLLCTIAPDQAYGLKINAAGDFKNADGRSAAPAELRFKTGDAGVFNVPDALSQAGLSAADEPVMRWPDPDVGKTTLASQPGN